ncbi:hypothetical protein [Pseudoalteromonas sp. Of7M-16]|uniref:hypothetical protein n=1 Tax=Pseudoalteromonas sp. Of7M-16 TaxID=2917756 RepID=UPI001EF70D8B|nr:hypothetical protein [Pseudoalteromonas sp. Of7M-16]MCG7551341.1 hypothetical protein [Pseudoalteromonas sp. Of7M-16]
MKISDDALLQAIWQLQLKMLSKRVVSRSCYVGCSVVQNDEYNYKSQSDMSMHLCHRVSDKIGKQQIRKRIKRLITFGLVDWAYQNLTFHINSPQAKQAFEYARAFWLSHGVPEYGHSITMTEDKIQHLESACFEALMSKFKHVELIALYDKFITCGSEKTK